MLAKVMFYTTGMFSSFHNLCLEASLRESRYFIMHIHVTSCSGSSSTTTAQQAVPSDDQPELFERIEATKLQVAVSNASAMGQLQVR